MTSKYFTVVFEITERTAFQDLLGKFTAAITDEYKFDGANVTGVGWGDAMSEAETYMEELIANGIDIPEILE